MSPGRCATARRAGWRCTQETGTPRRRAVPLFSALARFQKTRSASLEAHAPLGSQPPWAILVAASRHTSYNPAFFCQAQRWWIGRSRQPQNKSQNKRAALLQTQKLLHPILHGPAQVDKDATDGVSAGHLRRFGAAARKKCATAIARREAGTARRPSTRRPLQKAAQQRAVASRIQWCVAAAPLDVNAIAATQNSMIYDAGRRRLRRVRHVLLHDDGEAGLVRFVG